MSLTPRLSSYPISNEDIAHYQEQGYLVVPELFSAAEAAEAKRVITSIQQSEGNLSGVHVYFHNSLPPFFLQLCLDRRMVSVLQGIVGPDLEFCSAKPVFKSSRVSFATPWHQDYAYWGGASKHSVWLALEDATEDNGCLRIIPGSHRSFKPHQNVAGVGFGNQIPEAELAGQPMVSVPLRAGGAIFFHDLLLHASHENRARQDRWSFIPTYRSGAVADSSKVWQKTLLLSGHSVNACAVPLAEFQSAPA